MFFPHDLEQKFALCPSPYVENLDRFTMYSLFLARHLPADIKRQLAKLKSGQIDLVKIEPVTDRIETTPTPCDERAIGVKPNYFTEGVTGAIAAELGEIFGYREQNGYVIHDIFPIKGMEHSLTG